MEALYNEGLVVGDSIHFEERYDEQGELRFIRIHGRIECPHNVRLRVHKLLEVRRGRGNRHEVLGFDYSYHAILGDEESDLFRYDNAHGDTSTLHMHRYNLDGTEAGEKPVPLTELPTLASIIELAVKEGRARLPSH